ncbi:alpha/beta hydrolase [Geodermatophilus sabuli]|uniref:Acetyl esterase/lipase n=1 Tax=Geodermatophilus sabuli TaxID=1564158 RepID=A0A285EJS0_9ACTN|nr:alpha/beta hydrolase [Geodermatophilus sabuli]MBB3083822.1 acetyl esterase/lipase [Geodermatophilus sabuli]SNX99335.1 Acetyl esterase/lipase [Geodermatophilus sabuli]
MPTPALPLPPPAHAAPLPPPRPGPGGTRVLLGLPYAAVPGVRPLELDLYLPAGDGPAPVAVFLHGGGWRLGSRRSAGPAYPGSSAFEAVAQAGIAVASIDYRLSGEAAWPAQLHDAKAAVRWLRARAGELGVDAARTAAWGESAGGHLAALLGLTGDDPSLEGDVGVTGPSSAVIAVAAWYAPSDIATVAADTGADPADPDTREAQLLGAPVATVPDRAAQASPLTHVSPAAPPALLLHGVADRFVPCVQSERLAAALTAAGAEATLHTYADANHMWLGAPGAAADALTRTTAFLRARLAA